MSIYQVIGSPTQVLFETSTKSMLFLLRALVILGSMFSLKLFEKKY